MLRYRLDETIRRGAQMAVDKAAEDPESWAFNYVIRGIPDTIESLGVDTDVLQQRITYEISKRVAKAVDAAIPPE